MVDKPGNSFAAQLIERSATGYAGFASAWLGEHHPAMAARLSGEAGGGWRGHLTQRLLELAAALAAGEKRLFTARIAWSRRAFAARSQPEGDLAASIEALRETLAARLPANAAAEPLDYLDTALAELRAPLPALQESGLDASRPLDRLALRYLEKILMGNVTDAIDDIVAVAAGETGAHGVYLGILLPAQREIGRLWHEGEVTVAEEHLVTGTTQRAMAVIASRAPRAAHNGHTVVVAAVAGNIHDIGPRALADFFQMAGWRPIYVGADVPLQDLPPMLTFYDASALMMAATLATHVPRVAQAIADIRQRCGHPLRVIVGGAAFDEVPALWQRIGADGYAATIDDAVKVATRLVAG